MINTAQTYFVLVLNYSQNAISYTTMYNGCEDNEEKKPIQKIWHSHQTSSYNASIFSDDFDQSAKKMLAAAFIRYMFKPFCLTMANRIHTQTCIVCFRDGNQFLTNFVIAADNNSLAHSHIISVATEVVSMNSNRLQ